MNKQPEELKAVERIHVVTPEIFGDVVRADDYDSLLAEYKASQDALKSVTELWNEQRQRIAELERYAKERDAENEGLALTVGRLRAKLATPVRLPECWDVSGQVNPPRIVQVQFEQQNRTCNQCAEAIRAAGFKVEGDS